MRRQSVAQWFGKLDALREQVAWRYTRRWVILLSGHLARLYGAEAPDAVTVARLLLPEGDDEIVFARIWLALCEAGRSDASVAAAAAFGEAEQLARVQDWLPRARPSEHRAVCALASGLRAQLCSAEPIALADAWAVTEVLGGADELRR